MLDFDKSLDFINLNDEIFYNLDKMAYLTRQVEDLLNEANPIQIGLNTMDVRGRRFWNGRDQSNENDEIL